MQKAILSFSYYRRSQGCLLYSIDIVGKPKKKDYDRKLDNMLIASVVSKLRLDSVRGSSNNIWLAVLFVFILFGLNFNALSMPIWLLNFLVVTISGFGILSLLCHGYLLIKVFENSSIDLSLRAIAYFCLLSLVTMIICYLTYAIVFGIE